MIKENYRLQNDFSKATFLHDTLICFVIFKDCPFSIKITLSITEQMNFTKKIHL